MITLSHCDRKKIVTRMKRNATFLTVTVAHFEHVISNFTTFPKYIFINRVRHVRFEEWSCQMHVALNLIKTQQYLHLSQKYLSRMATLCQDVM